MISAIFNSENEEFVKDIEESLKIQSNQRFLQTCTSPCLGCNPRSSTACTSCVTGYYLSGSSCIACLPQCSTCSSSTTCIVCLDTVHTSPLYCTCPTNSSLIGSSCVCNQGYYFSSNKVCSACATQCSVCSVSSSNCTTCLDTVHMSTPACECPSNSALVGSACICNKGYYFSSNTVCSACSIQCATCSDSDSKCDSCLDSVHMSSSPTCACPDNSTIVDSACVCNPGYYFSTSSVCSPCANKCATCSHSSIDCNTCTDSVHMTPPACECPQNSAFINGSCVCSTGYFYSSLTTCSACNENCGSCTTSIGNCLTCSDTNHMTAAPECACPINANLAGGFCKCNTGFYFSSSSECSPCSPQCATCTVNDNVCSSCIDPIHNSSPPNCYCPANSQLTAGSCVCDSGFYFSSSAVCSACPSSCATCDSGTSCLTCLDTVHMTEAPSCQCPENSFIQGGSCVCNDGYYFSNFTTCSPCQNNCKACSDAAENCLTCSDSVHMSAAPACACPPNSTINSIGQCVCNAGYFYTSNHQCSPCSPQCSTCSVSSSTCLTCIDTVHMGNPPTCSCPASSTLTAGVCTCNTGLYFSLNTVCSTCAPQCLSCSDSESNCGLCIDIVHMSEAPACACPENSNLVGGFCICNTGYYYSTNKMCSPCSSQCAACTVDANVCSSCIDPIHSSSPPNCYCSANSQLTAGSCVCYSGFYFSSSSACSACPSNCATCNSETSCLTCLDTVHMTEAPSCQCPENSSMQGGSCTCNTGYYFSGSFTCSPCQENCQTCSDTAENCLSCFDTAHMSAAPACACPTNSEVNTNWKCVCNAGYFYSADHQCSPCSPQCSTCSDSSSACLTCFDTIHMSSPPNCLCPVYSTLTAGSCTCDPGFYFSSNTVCSSCDETCAACSGSDNCLSCKDPLHATPSGGICQCDSGFYWVASSYYCDKCAPKCASCASTETNCGSCIDIIHMSAAPNCACPRYASLIDNICVCNTGYYFSSPRVCFPCQENCETCDLSFDKCDSCADKVHMSDVPDCLCPTNSALSGDSCVCNTGYYYSSNTTCSPCQNNCKACSDAAENCLTYSDSVHMSAAPACACPPNSTINSIGQCVCNAGYFYTSNHQCSPCSPQCSTCSVSSSTCLTCIDTVHMGNPPTCSCQPLQLWFQEFALVIQAFISAQILFVQLVLHNAFPAQTLKATVDHV
ncbi:unnamed protein product [Blepharisma stoltei]|uniref:EGF-like domain-containing protein n=1 Tax=Blepharisma stoltei TaxID=1481888 RepID=A0AAU9JX32_9CILI|nr:unnamed protein product [Blepharisma stoltei]